MSSPSDADAIRFQLESVDMNIEDFAIKNITELANKIIIDRIHEKMRAANYSKKIIDRTFLAGVEIKQNRAIIHVISDYTAENGFNVADAREKGTKKHRIEPKNSRKSSVAGLSDGPQALAFIFNGKLVFSMGHDVPGIKATHIIRDTMQEDQDLLELMYRVREEKWFVSHFSNKTQKGVTTQW